MINSEINTTPPPSYYVGIGASAGGLEALERFFLAVPKCTGMAYIIIQHLSPDYKSMMVELLSKKTLLPVLRATEGMIVAPDTIYLIPPKKNLTIFHGKLLLSDQPPHDRWINLPIDIFFRSLAEDQGEKSIGIILSGTGSDGSRGVRTIKEYGGMIMVQDEKDAKFDGMPKSAMSSGIADYILKAEEMPAKLISYTKHPHLTGTTMTGEIAIEESDDFTTIFSLLRAKTKVDFTEYKQSTVIRRIERRMGINQLDDLRDYVNLLRTNSRELITLYHELLIGVTSFFRDKEAFIHLSEHVLPNMLAPNNDKGLRFWVVGCSTGEEAYSLAILLLELLEDTKDSLDIQIFATDVDNDAIMMAGSGVYPESIAADIEPARLAKYFHRQGDSYRVSQKVRKMVVFAQHNLLKDPPFTNIDFISCRNLFIYLQPVLQQRALEMFNFSLNPGGMLFLGSSETVGDMFSHFQPIHHRWKIYQSKGKQKLPPASTSFKYSPAAANIACLSHPVSATLPLRQTVTDDKLLCEKLLTTLAGDILPLTVVVNEELEIIYTVGDTGDFFRLPTGKMQNDIRKMVNKEIAIPLSMGIQKALKAEDEIRYSNIRLNAVNDDKLMNVTIRPFSMVKNQPLLVAVVMQEVSRHSSKEGDTVPDMYDFDKETEQRIVDLEQELQFTKENLQATIEELETSNEELQATNEELLASNEELQSTNEELQSVNQELYTVNSEHQRKIIELTELNNDIDNLFVSTEIGTIFLDDELNLRKFSPHSQNVFNIIESDLGRPFHHITHTLLGVDLHATVKKVLASEESVEFKAPSANDKWFYIRIMPYNIAPKIFAGVVITLVEISDLVGAEKALTDSKARLNLAEKVVDFASWQLHVESGRMEFSQNLAKLHGVAPGDMSNSYAALLSTIHPEDRQHFEDEIARAVAGGNDYEIQHRVAWPDKSIHTLKQIGIASPGKNGKAKTVTGVTVDVTDTENTDSSSGKLGLFQDISSNGLIIIDDRGTIESVNSEVENIFGYSAEEMIGRNVKMLMPRKFQEEHDIYISRYLTTGIAKIIGKGRVVTGLCKDSSEVALFLAVGEIRIGKRVLFSGVLTRQMEAELPHAQPKS